MLSGMLKIGKDVNHLNVNLANIMVHQDLKITYQMKLYPTIWSESNSKDHLEEVIVLTNVYEESSIREEDIYMAFPFSILV